MTSRLRLPLGLALAGLGLLSCARGTSVLTSDSGPVDPGPGGDPVDPPSGPSDFTPTAGLVSVAAGPGAVRVDWRVPGERADELELALYRAFTRATVYDGNPVATDLSGTSVMATGLTDGRRLFFGLALRERGSGTPFRPTGAIVSATPGPVMYVDPSASAMGADGLTPQTAFPDPRIAILSAGFLPGRPRNIWLRAGTYPNVGFIPQGAGIHVFGGFDANFDLATRDTSPGTTVLVGLADAMATPTIVIEMQELASIPVADPIAVLDGVTLDGAGVAAQGVEITETAAELRAVTIERFLGRGLRLQSTAEEDFDVVLTGSDLSRNGAEGLDGNGPFDYFVDGCEFNSNVQEGFDLDDWIAPPGESVALRISSSRFFGNGSEGLDVDMNVPPFVLDLQGGTFSVEIRGCAFERNGLDGLLLDLEYELFPNWNAEIVVRESLARANAGNGFAFDLDGPASTFTHRLLAAGNDAAGIEVSSESDPGLAIVAASVAAANLGDGFLVVGPLTPGAPGNRVLAASHCVLSGNLGPAIRSVQQMATAASSIVHLQPEGTVGTELLASVTVNDPVAPLFLNAPEEIGFVVSALDDVVTLSTPPAFGPGVTVELADDGVERLVVSVLGNDVKLDPAPELVLAPDALAAFPDRSVREDYRLASGATAIGAGLGGADAGVYADSALADAAPPGFASQLRAPLFHPTTTTPAPAELLAPFADITIRFNLELDPSSASAASLRVVDGSGAPLDAGIQTTAERLVLSPPPGGWGVPVVRVELLDGLRSLGGLENAAPLVLRFATGS